MVTAVILGANLLLLALGGCLSNPQRDAARFDARLQRTVEALKVRGDADSLAAAALMRLPGPTWQADSAALLERATALPPERPELLWLQLQACGVRSLCDAAPIEARLRRVDPTNGASWLPALARASAAQDERGIEAALLAVGRSEQVKVYRTTLIARLSAAAAATRELTLGESMIQISGMLSAIGPPYTAIVNACRGDALQRAQRVSLCQGVAQSLRRSDGVLTEIIGVSIARQAWPAHSPEWNAALEARRVFDYRSQALAAGYASVPWTPAGWRRYVDLLRSHEREQDFMIAQLRARKIDPMPPANWNVPTP